MMKNFFKSQKGVNLISLAIVVIIILILTNMVIYNVKDNLKLQKLRNMQTDIENLRGKVSSYYSQYGKLPVNTDIEYTNTNNIKASEVISEEVDTGKFYVIDLSAIENVTLNYGKDYEQIRNGSVKTEQEINTLEDLYIINGASHNIFYAKGIELDGEKFYTDYTKEDKDTVAVNLRYVDNVKIPEGFYYVEGTKDTGIVISDEPGDDLENSKKGNQFVWVPVEDINTMAQCETAGGDCNLELVDGKLKCTNPDHSDTSEKIVGKLWATKLQENFGEENTTYEQNGLREPDIVANLDNNSSNNDGLFTLESLKRDYKLMATSVAKNKGFYIGRYETSSSTATETNAGTSGTASSKAGVIPTSANNTASSMWYGLYKISSTYTVEEGSVQSSMIWGSQYDAMLNWVKNGNGADKDKIKRLDLGGNYSKAVATTGNSNYSKDSINNIRDLGGNLGEWTLEANGSDYRIRRGGTYENRNSPSYRDYNQSISKIEAYGTRLTLYLTEEEKWSPSYDKTAVYEDKNGDTASIPKGFQVSQKQGEDEIEDGLVVKGPDGSEFVWIPVEDINTMAQCETSGGNCNLKLVDGKLKCTNPDHSDTAEKIVGKLWATSTGENFGTENTTYTPNSGLREPDIVTDHDNNPSNNDDLFTLESLKGDYKLMATSVAKNKGFYIGRYETSLSTATETNAGTSGTASSKEGVIPTSAENTASSMWYGLYKISSTYTVEEGSVQSSMIWGSQYDAMLNWVKNEKGTDKEKISQNTNGNHTENVVTTGNKDYSEDKIKNIRDLEGNLLEWTLEAFYTYDRVFRGGSCENNNSPSYRYYYLPYYTNSHFGSRLTLYIKDNDN